MKTRFLIPVLLLLTACSTGVTSLTEEQKDKVKREGELAVQELLNAFSVNDSAKVMAMTLSGPELSMVGASGVLNYSDLRKLINQFFPKIEKQTFETKTEKYVVIDPACFIFTWYGKNGVYFRNGESIIYDDYLISMVFRKINGEWKMVYDHESLKYPMPEDPVKEFTKVEVDWNTAMMNMDRKALELLFAKEYTYTEPNGKTSNREEDLELLTSGRYKLLAQPVLSNISVNLYETVALVRGQNTIKGTLDGKDMSGTNQFTDVFVWREGRWQCVSTQSVKVQKK
jgi:hypothetical protein